MTLKDLVDDFISKKWPHIRYEDISRGWVSNGFGVCWMIDGDSIDVIDEYYISKKLNPAIPEFFDELSIFINSRMRKIERLPSSNGRRW
jgi:hypothetical protein